MESKEKHKFPTTMPIPEEGFFTPAEAFDKGVRVLQAFMRHTQLGKPENAAFALSLESEFGTLQRTDLEVAGSPFAPDDQHPETDELIPRDPPAEGDGPWIVWTHVERNQWSPERFPNADLACGYIMGDGTAPSRKILTHDVEIRPSWNVDGPLIL